MAFEIPVGDLLPRWEVRLRDNFDTTKDPVDLTEFDSAVFAMRETGDSGHKVLAAADIDEEPADGLVFYEWVIADVDTAGTYQVKVILMQGAKPKTYPNTGFWTVVIGPQIT